MADPPYTEPPAADSGENDVSVFKQAIKNGAEDDDGESDDNSDKDRAGDGGEGAEAPQHKLSADILLQRGQRSQVSPHDEGKTAG